MRCWSCWVPAISGLKTCSGTSRPSRPDKFGVRIGYDNALAHRIEAGSDMFLMPSLYEPCGLNQIYSLHYGTVPIVRATGGLDDTVDSSTGFKFGEYSPASAGRSDRRGAACLAVPRCLDGADARRYGKGFFVGGVGGRVSTDVCRTCIPIGHFLHHKY